ncbi:glycosyltransferase [Thermodesulfobacteriota bacterium]
MSRPLLLVKLSFVNQGTIHLTPSVDIIIPCYNTGKYLRQAIDSALAQDFGPVNVLVVDDGSTDNTREIVESFRGRVQYLFQKNQGLAGARNSGVRNSQADYVCFLDADDIILPAMISENVQSLQDNPELGISHGKTLMFIDGDVLHAVAEPWRPFLQWNDYVEPLGVMCALHLGSAVIRRSLLQRLGGFPDDLEEQGCEDWAFLFKCVLDGVRIGYCPRVHSLYRQHRGSMSSRESAIVARESNLMTHAAGMFNELSPMSQRRRRILSYGIKSGAIRWLPLGGWDKFRQLVKLSEGVLRFSDQDSSLKGLFAADKLFPETILYLALSKAFLDVGHPELATVMILKCRDIRILRKDTQRFGKTAMFDEVVGHLIRLAREARSEGVNSTSPQLEHPSSDEADSDPFAILDAMVPHDASILGYLEHQLALLDYRRGDMPASERALRESIRRNPNSAMTHLDLGRVLLRGRRFRESRKEIGWALHSRPTEILKYVANEIDVLAHRLLGVKWWALRSGFLDKLRAMSTLPR